jgi:hypothetical protein
MKLVLLHNFYWSAYIKSGNWEVMYFCATDFVVSVIFLGFNFINRTSNTWHNIITKTFDVKMKLSQYNFINLALCSSSKCFLISRAGEHEAIGSYDCGSMTAVCRMDKDKHAWIRTTEYGSKNFFYTNKEGPQSSFMGIIMHG